MTLLAVLLAFVLGVFVGLALPRRRRRHHPSATPVALVLFTSREGADLPMQIRDNQTVHYSLELVDAAGNPVTDGPETATPEWSLDRTDLVRLEVAEDGLQGNAIAIGGLGDTVLTVSVQLPDETDGEGNTVPGKLLQGSDVISIVGDDVAAEIKLTADQVTDQ